ncbi:hypothetical protein HN51_043817 [Arachis hypogaea]
MIALEERCCTRPALQKEVEPLHITFLDCLDAAVEGKLPQVSPGLFMLHPIRENSIERWKKRRKERLIRTKPRVSERVDGVTSTNISI